MELPPRARRIPRTTRKPSTCMGTTSACAENTRAPGLYPHQARNYLRVRGEYQIRKNVRCPASELPPRARRIHVRGCCFVCVMGTTSACAENTEWWLRYAPLLGNYLRVRGEYILSLTWAKPPWELPPRARRIPHPPSRGRSSPGTTSACAENTVVLQDADTGESELPPRARRIHLINNQLRLFHGTTSACAENTGQTP